MDKKGKIAFTLIRATPKPLTESTIHNKRKQKRNINEGISAKGVPEVDDCPRPLFYNRDTPGYDETIISALPTEFWDRVYGGIFEIRKIKGKSFSKEKVVTMLEKFKFKMSLETQKKELNTKDIIDLLEDKDIDARDFDICFWN